MGRAVDPRKTARSDGAAAYGVGSYDGASGYGYPAYGYGSYASGYGYGYRSLYAFQAMAMVAGPPAGWRSIAPAGTEAKPKLSRDRPAAKWE